MKKLLLAAAAGTVLAACVNTTTTEVAEEDAETVVVEVEETVEEVVEEVQASAPELCLDAGPQTPRDISSTIGLNTVTFPKAPPSTSMNLCNIHTHTNAEHKGPGFSVFVDATDNGGYACNETADLTEAELMPSEGAYKGVVPGQTIEVHWVHTTCDATPGEGLGACVPEGCTDPLLRVEAQTFLVVNDENALDFTVMADVIEEKGGFYQAGMIPSDTGTPVTFPGSTTGPSYTQAVCSPAQVTWNVRPMCAKLDINSLHAWAEGNVFNETESHGVRQLVTAPELLSPIQ
ncbi:MAG: delta-class carbonic anhydrase [Hyphomonadaceae bacterium]|nr:delta-class carbonic anhydrase [Hyphomonadaceae bacterium]